MILNLNRKVIKMDEKIIYQNKFNMISFEFLYFNGGYNIYEISVATLGFSGTYNFCISESEQINYENKINEMIRNLNGSMEIKDCDSDAFIKFYFESITNFYVSGQLGGSWNDNILKFKFKADQTLLYGLKRNLNI